MENDADILLYNTEWGEMNIKEELNRTIAKRQSIVDEISELEMRKQELLQEALRLDGELRLLKRMDGDEKPTDTFNP